MNLTRQSLAAGLYLVGVPIGNARDITLRALDTLASADVLAAEDTRAMRKLMGLHGLALDGRRIVALHDHSGTAVVQRLIGQVQAGHAVAYASEAGMPLIADPGFELVRAARAADVPVTCVPGPSAVTSALALAGLPTDAFHFAGFLPNSSGARKKALRGLQGIDATLVFYESPHRLSATLHDAAEVLGADREAAVCRELTKKFEEVLRGPLATLAERIKAAPVKGEIVLLVQKNDPGEVDVSEKFVDERLQEALKTLSVKDAAQAVARETGLKRRRLYQRALELSGAS